MDPNNVTCIQKIKFFFYFYEKREWAPNEGPPLKKVARKGVQPEDIRYLKDFLNVRLERIAKMMELFLSIHDDWAITGKKNYILMETTSYDFTTFDFQTAVKALKENGFHDDEYILKLEYERMWGVL